MSSFSADLLAEALAGLPATARLWIAYSGGVDSHVLLHACAGLGPRLAGGRLRAVHVDHGLQPASAAWAAHCRAVCAGLGVPLTERRLALAPIRGESLEALARDARYQALAALLGPGDWLATAHHQDDQAETLLLALLRGSGVHGLAAMPRRAVLGDGWLVRPLLDCNRAALLAYAQAQGLLWLEDPSNTDTDRDRNLLRSRVLPLLRERWPAAARTLARSAGHCGEAVGLIDGLADGRLPGLAGGRACTLSVRGLRGLPAEQARALLRRWLARAGFRPPPAGRLRCILEELLPARADRHPLVGWAGCEVRRYRDDLFALAPLPRAPPPETVAWSRAQPHPLPGGLGELVWSGPATAAPVGLRVGFMRPGLGAARVQGSRQSLTELFQAAGIPTWLRPLVPLLFDNETLIGPVGLGVTATWPLVWRGHPWPHLYP